MIQPQYFQPVRHIPSIELGNISHAFFCQNSYKMSEKILPNTTFDVMHGIHYKHLKKVVTVR